MEPGSNQTRIAERKARDRQARHAQIVRAARRIAEEEGWSSVTVRRLADEISYSQPVLYSHFSSREAILAAVATEGFQELGLALEEARLRAKRGDPVLAMANAYLQFAGGHPALYEAMFSLSSSLRFDDVTTPPELHFAFSQLLVLFAGKRPRPEVRAEVLWASLHGLAELTRSQRLPAGRQKERVRLLVALFGSAED